MQHERKQSASGRHRLFFYCSCEKGIHLAVDQLRDGTLLLVLYVLVNCFKHVRRCMAHPLHGIEIRDAQRQHGGSVIVAEIVEPAADACLLAQAVPALRYAVRIKRHDIWAFFCPWKGFQ